MHFYRRVRLHLLLQKGRLINAWVSVFCFLVFALAVPSVRFLPHNRKQAVLSAADSEPRGWKRAQMYAIHAHLPRGKVQVEDTGRGGGEDSSVRFVARKQLGWSLKFAAGELASLQATVGETNLAACVEAFLCSDTTDGIWRFMHNLKRLWECTWMNLRASVSATLLNFPDSLSIQPPSSSSGW